MDITKVTEKLSVSAQPQLKDFASLKAQASQRSSTIAPTGRAAGLAYFHIPVTSTNTNMPGEAVRRFKNAIDHAPGPVLAHCRNGARSFFLWVLSIDLQEHGGPATPLSSRPGLASKRSATRNREARCPNDTID